MGKSTNTFGFITHKNGPSGQGCHTKGIFLKGIGSKIYNSDLTNFFALLIRNIIHIIEFDT